MNAKRYNEIMKNCRKLVLERNRSYGNSVDVIDLHTLVGIVIMKLTRIYKLGRHSKIEDELTDAVNYLIFALNKLREVKVK